MPTKPYPITFKGSVTPTATKFLKAEPLVMDFSGTIDLDETDASHLSNLQKAFQSEMESRLKAQLGHLNTWLAEKDKTIDSMVKRFEALKKEGFPQSPQAAATRAQTIKELAVLGTQINQFPEDYKKIVQDWAENAREQQALVSMKVAVKNARVLTYNDKAWRVRAGQTVKAILVVLAIGASIAAIVMSAGATAPLFIGLAAAGASIAGISSLAGLGKMLKENATIEKKLMANVSKDVETVRNALKPLDNCKSSLAKHVTELRNLMKIREDNIRQYNTEIQKQTVAARSYASALDKLKTDPSIPGAEISKRQKKIDGLNAELKSTSDSIKKLESDNAAAQKMLDDLEAMNVQLDKISGQSANSLAGNLKARFTSLDGWVDLGNTVGSLINTSSGIHT
jgi:chromosome segregation ATPase